jgi:hypothetical protein
LDCLYPDIEFVLVSSSDEQLQYRFKVHEDIEVSKDGGTTWKDALKFDSLSDVEIAYYQRNHWGYPQVAKGPFDAVIDPDTGNVIFAMGHQGILLFDKSGSWRFVGVDEYRYYDLEDFSSQIDLIFVELYSALGVGLLHIVTSVMWLFPSSKRKAFTGISWLILVGLVVLFRPAFLGSYGLLFVFPFMFIVGIMIVIGVVESLIRIVRAHWLFLLPILLRASISSILYAAPFVLWVLKYIPLYNVALVLSLTLTALSLAFEYWRSKVRSAKDLSSA